MNRQEFVVQETGAQDRSQVCDFVVCQWGAEQMVVHGESFCLPDFPGLMVRENGQITALLIYRRGVHMWEILSLDSLRPNRGAATSLILALEQKARASGCDTLTVTTTNDNLHALRFYQKRGFDLMALHRFAVDEARKQKPQIPLSGMDGIPIHHEIELVKSLDQKKEVTSGDICDQG